MRISDWSSDVCSSDLLDLAIRRPFSMIFNPNFYRLTLLHRQLDDAERREARRRGADPFRLLRLKTLKLAVKERLAALTLRSLRRRSEEHTSELQSLMRISYAVFCLKKKNTKKTR